MLLNVYYGNIKQGEIPVSFTIDKLPPKAPVLSIEDDAVSGSNAVAVSVFSEDDVYTAIDTKSSALEFGEAAQPFARDSEPDENVLFMPFAGTKVCHVKHRRA